MTYLSIYIYIILEIKVALIWYSLSQTTSKAAENNGPIGLIGPHSAPCWQYRSQSGAWANQMMVTTAKSGGSCADGVFPLMAELALVDYNRMLRTNRGFIYIYIYIYIWIAFKILPRFHSASIRFASPLASSPRQAVSNTFGERRAWPFDAHNNLQHVSNRIDRKPLDFLIFAHLIRTSEGAVTFHCHVQIMGCWLTKGRNFVLR